jgi:hypothetical protein
MEELLALPLGDLLTMSGSEEGAPLMVAATLNGAPCAVFIVSGADVEKLKALALQWAGRAAEPVPEKAPTPKLILPS